MAEGRDEVALVGKALEGRIEVARVADVVEPGHEFGLALSLLKRKEFKKQIISKIRSDE